MISGRKLKHSIQRRNPCHLQWEEFLGKAILQTFGKIISVQFAYSVGSTDNRDWVMNALGTVPGHNDVINVHELQQIVRGLKSKKAVGNDGIPSEVHKFASERLLTFMSIFLSECMLSGKIPSTLMHIVIIPLLKRKSRDPADVNNYRPIAIATALSKVLEQVLLSRLARYLWTADSQFGLKRAHGTEMAIFALKQTVDFYRNQDTPVYMCFLDAKNTFDRVNYWMLAKKLLDRNVPLHIVKLFIFWYREHEFMVRWGNALSMTFR